MLRTVGGRTYQLIVEGEVSDDLLPALPGVRLDRRDGNTALTGFVRDQAELQGLLQRVAGLGMTLLEAKSVEDEQAESRSPLRAAPSRTAGTPRPG
jgi:hypothetical protein